MLKVLHTSFGSLVQAIMQNRESPDRSSSELHTTNAPRISDPAELADSPQHGSGLRSTNDQISMDADDGSPAVSSVLQSDVSR